MSTTKKAENIRDVIRYLQKFNNALVVIYLDDNTIESSLFSSHIRDIALLHQAGIKVVIIPGSRTRIDQVLSVANIQWTYKDNIRITSEEAMPYIKMASFDVTNTVMTSLAANNINAITGNWVRARSKGVLEGFDYSTAGEIDKLQVEAVRTVLNDGFVPIFPCIGLNSVGHPYNISSVLLAQQVAIALQADKLFYVTQDCRITTDNFSTQNINELAISESGDIAAMNLEQIEEFLALNKKPDSTPEQNKVFSLLQTGAKACQQGVTRVHFVNGNTDGVLLTEIFSDFGSGTMLYTSNYGKIRQMQQTDIPSVLAVMAPFIEAGKLLPRTQKDLSNTLDDFIVYELDGGIHACAALHKYSDGQQEIAAVAVDESFAHMGIGPKMISHLIQKAKASNAKSIFIMTTQSADWFEKLGFSPDAIESLPLERKALWNQKRNSKVYRLK